MKRGSCKTCGDAIWWVELVSGASHPVELEQVEPAIGVVAFRPDTGKAMVLRGEHLTKTTEWTERYRVTYWRSHFNAAACAAAARVSDDQVALF